MAAYPFHDQSFYNVIVDSSYSSSSSSLMFPNTNISLPQSINSINMSGILEEPNNNNNNNSTGAYLFSSNSGNNSGISVFLQNHPPLPNMDHKRKYCNSSNHTSSAFNSNTPLSKDNLEVLVSKGKKQRKITVSNSDDGPMLKGSDDNEERKKKKIGRRASCNNKKNKIEKVQQEEQVATGYIHVRARRGQATNSHSLAERVRREKIGERMKILQALVPGCDKVTGKALMLDEIINYVQSLQNQVEFLSMKIGSVNPMFHDFGMDLDTFMIKPEGSSLEEAQQADVQNRCSPKQSTTNTFNTTTAPSPNNYSFPLLDPSAILLFQQAQMSNILTQSQPQNNGQLLWDNAEQGHKLFTPYSSFTKNLPPFH